MPLMCIISKKSGGFGREKSGSKIRMRVLMQRMVSSPIQTLNHLKIVMELFTALSVGMSFLTTGTTISRTIALLLAGCSSGVQFDTLHSYTFTLLGLWGGR